VETRPAAEVVRLTIHEVVDELVVDGLEVELDATFSSSVDEHVEDAESEVAVVTRAHERRLDRVGIMM